MFEGRCKEKMVSFHLILTGEELYVKADSAKIDQVMHNLVDNAFKFSHSNSEITIETTLRNGKSICLSQRSRNRDSKGKYRTYLGTFL